MLFLKQLEKYRPSLKTFGLDEVNRDFILKALILAKKRCSVGIISNKPKLLQSWRWFLTRHDDLSPDNFGAYVRGFKGNPTLFYQVAS